MSIEVGDPIPQAGTGTTGWEIVSFFTVDAEGCTVRFGAEQQYYQLKLTRPNYNALFSLLLACWVNPRRVRLEYAIPIISPSPIPDPPAPLSIVSIVALPDWFSD